jgi:plastocyanin domain-containing protein
MDKILVTISGILGIVFVGWFFFGKKEKNIVVGDRISIAVAGGYDPSSITLKKGKKTVLSFLRTDPSSCLDEVVLPDFSIRKSLPLHEKVDIVFTPQKTGVFGFHCGMNMYHGKITVVD